VLRKKCADRRRRADSAVMIAALDLGAALAAFIAEHEYCGELDASVEDERVWMTCTCGAGDQPSAGPRRPRKWL